MKKIKSDKNLQKAEELRKELKEVIKFMSISQKEAIDLIALHENEEYSQTRYESFKKFLQRSNNVQKLNYYITILKQSEKYRMVSTVVYPQFGDEKIIGKEKLAFFHQMSKEISMLIENRESSEDIEMNT